MKNFGFELHLFLAFCTIFSTNTFADSGIHNSSKANETRAVASDSTEFENLVEHHLNRTRFQDVANELVYRSVNNIGCEDFENYFLNSLLPRLEALRRKNVSFNTLKNLVWDYSKRRYKKFNFQYGISTDSLNDFIEDYLVNGDVNSEQLKNISSLGTTKKIKCLNIRPEEALTLANEDSVEPITQPEIKPQPTPSSFPRIKFSENEEDKIHFAETETEVSPETEVVAIPEPIQTPTPESLPVPEAAESDTSSSQFLYAGKGPETKLRQHPSQLEGLNFIRKRGIGHIEGVGFAFGNESVFKNNVNMMSDNHYSPSGKSGAEFIRVLENYTSQNGCVPKLLIGAHGHYTSNSRTESAISRAVNRGRSQQNVFYRTSQSENHRISIEGLLKSKIQNNSIKFCQQCEIYIHACNIAHNFSKSLAQNTGCRVISATDKVSPVSPTYTDQKVNGNHYPNIGEYEQVWFTSGRGDFYEYLPTGQAKKIGKSFVADPDFIQQNNFTLK